MDLCESACRSDETRGRKTFEKPCDFRTEFQRDRDRIIHSSAFRRLKRKTQVFLSPVSEHYRTRLTHTLEVSQIARTIARALRLNEDLTEAIALGHDLGHTPFGHDGERALDKIFDFRHNIQSVRVVDVLEKDGSGLNLTQEVRDGILNHRGGTLSFTHEGRVVRLADKIAYINHDIEDAVRAGVLSPDELPPEAIEHLGDTKSKRITSLVRSIIENGETEIKYDSQTQKAHDLLRNFMFDRVYNNEIVNAEKKKSEFVIERLFEYYLKNIDKMPALYKTLSVEYGKQRAVCDFISGMSDDYAIGLFSEIFIPKSWPGGN
ncbi:MAG: deoxyguanosinetriphosphate triphosphohydrolase [Oscillospiraceae bacterium]|nr:deoxyguanosinetriphosphate triphosphohydrolase [Oscillospiraceae bacterium]